ncbi:DUF3566 domain-containing protein [Candidatus Neomarinimicrobiota bacterium]
MSRVLIREIQVWSVARTVFPLGWIISFLIILGSYLLIGGLVTDLASDYSKWSVVERGAGIIGGILLSLVMGFFSSILITLTAVITAVIYNFLAALGGGFAINLTESAPAPPSTGDKADTDKTEGTGTGA